MTARLQFSGSALHRAQSAAVMCRATADVCLRRLRKGPLCAQWNLAAEVGTEILKRQLLIAFEMQDVNEARSYLDSLAFNSGALSKVGTAGVEQEDVNGSWIVPNKIDSDVTILYLHGGGYSFHPRSFYNNLAALIALSTGSRLFALDYRLTPEHQFPAQLMDAAAGYRWLLSEGVNPRKFVVAGDSAGGNLTLALLLSLRDSKLPLPALAVCLSPATDFSGSTTGEPVDSEYDWITPRMALKWADWFCPQERRSDPLVSPVNADLRGLPPIYIQAGGSEILLPSIQVFAERAKVQGADVILETWAGMNHDFQAFGEEVPQSAEAIKRIGEVIASRIQRKKEWASAV
ncbi:MAG: alpha/beta hydrolase [Candidatus Korobacteraceae bacterium]|jgi:acetyl esterase/lipase